MFILAMLLALGAPTVACHATDGDSIRCGRERIRLLAIDAPEMRGHCRNGRVCAPGDPNASLASLAAGKSHGKLSVDRIGKDRYGRTLAVVHAGTTNLSCWQLRHGMALYMKKWDDGGRIGSACP